WPHFVDFDFAVKHKKLAGLEAAFQVAAVKKLDGQLAGFILHEEMIDGVAAAHPANGLATHHASAHSVNSAGLDVFEVGEMDAVFVAKRQIAEQIFERVNVAFSEQLGALRADAFDHAHFGSEVHPHVRLLVSGICKYKSPKPFSNRGFASTNPRTPWLYH